MQSVNTFPRDTDRPFSSGQFRSVFRIGKSDRQKSPDHGVDPRAASENKQDWKSTAYATTTELPINLVKESSDTFPLSNLSQEVFRPS